MQTSTQECGLMVKKMAKAPTFSMKRKKNTSEHLRMETSFRESGDILMAPISKVRLDSTSLKARVNGISKTET